MAAWWVAATVAASLEDVEEASLGVGSVERVKVEAVMETAAAVRAVAARETARETAVVVAAAVVRAMVAPRAAAAATAEVEAW